MLIKAHYSYLLVFCLYSSTPMQQDLDAEFYFQSFSLIQWTPKMIFNQVLSCLNRIMNFGKKSFLYENIGICLNFRPHVQGG